MQRSLDSVVDILRVPASGDPAIAVLPVRIGNLIAGGKNLGTTHITNGCFRLHPVEWNVGEAAGALAAFALEAKFASSQFEFMMRNNREGALP